MKDIDKRRQKKMDKALEERDLLRLWRKQEKLWQGKRAFNILELDKPFQRGYIRFFVLRPDIAKSDEARIYKPLLQWINNRVRCHDKSFMYKPWNSKVKKPISQGISSITHKDWIKIEPTLTLKQKSMFDKIWHIHHNSKGKPAGTGEWKFHFTKPWMFVYKIEPYFVTHRVVINPQLESETAKLWNRIWSGGRYYKIGKILGWKQDRDWEDKRKSLIMRALEKDKKEDLHVLENWHYYEIDDDCNF